MSEDIMPILTNLASGLLGGLVVAIVNHYLTKSREAAKSTASDQKDRAATASAWLREVRGIAAGLKAEVIRAQIPTDWLPSFQLAIIEFRRLESAQPQGLPTTQGREICSVLDKLCTMSDADAMNGAQKVADTLERLEALTRST